MNNRRHFIKLILGGFAGLRLIFSPLVAGIRLVWAKAKKIILPKGTRMKNLIGKDPANLGTLLISALVLIALMVFLSTVLSEGENPDLADAEFLVS